MSIRVAARYLQRPIGPRPRRRRCSAHLLLGGKATGEFVEDEVGVDRCHASYQDNEHPFHLLGTHTTKAAWLAHAREHSESYDGVW